MAKNSRCFFVNMTGVQPFTRCQYCERQTRDCFGIQFLVISTAIILLLIITFFITDLPALVLDMMITVTVLVAMLAYLASKETNEIVLNNVFLNKLNRDLEAKVDQRTQELETSNEELKKIDQMKNEFIGVINHELKTPITAILSGLEIIRVKGVEKFEDTQKKMLGIMEHSGHDMLRLANNLLDLSKIESGKIELYPDHFPLATLLEEVAASLRPEAEKKNVRIEVKVDEGITNVYADPDRLKQVMFNLTDNAVKYTASGGSVVISAFDSAKEILISVKDTGIGIKPDDINSIFNKFSKHVPGYKGTGLGLYISKSFIEAHNGIIEVSSEYGKGTTFIIHLPKVRKS